MLEETKEQLAHLEERLELLRIFGTTAKRPKAFSKSKPPSKMS
jgi:hypothetical protein